MSDVQTYALIALSSRTDRRSSGARKARSVTATDGISRAEMMLRLRQHHGIDWQWDRVVATVAALVAAGALVQSVRACGGYQVASWDVMDALAQEVEHDAR